MVTLLGLVSLGHTAEPPASDGRPAVVTDPPSFWNAIAGSTSHPIRMEAVVKHYDPEWNLLWVEVNGVPGYITCATLLPIRNQDRFLIEGTVIPRNGLSADTATVTVLEHDVPVKPIEIQGRLGDSLSLDSRIVTFEATFDRERISEPSHLMVDLVADSFRVHLVQWTPHPNLLHLKQGSRVRVKGLYIAFSDALKGTKEINLWCSRVEDIVLLSEPENDPQFNLPLIRIADLYDSYQQHTEKTRVAGIFRGYAGEGNMRLRDESGEVVVQTLQTYSLQNGDWVEAVGRPFAGGADWLLQKSVARRALPSVIEERSRDLAAPVKVLKLADQILGLSAKEAAEGRPVAIFGVTIWADAKADFIYVRDTSGAVRVQLPGKAGALFKVNSQLKISGVTETGVFAPGVRMVVGDQIGVALRPEAKSVSLEQVMAGHNEGQLVEIRGYVQHVKSEGDWTYLQVGTQTGTFEVMRAREESLTSVKGSIISVRGVCQALANTRRQLTGIQILATDGDDLVVEQPALTNPFAVPLSEISALRQFSTDTAANYWVRVRGAVIHQVPGRYVVIEDGSEGLLLLSEQLDPLSPGDTIEVTGLPGLENGRVVLRESIYRKTGHAGEPAPVSIAEPSTINDTLDSRLVKLKGTLVTTMQDRENVNLVLQTGPFVFAAVLRDSSAERLGHWPAGSLLELKGVYEVVRDERRAPRGFRVQLRSEADVRILQNPSWWTPGRAFAVTGLLVGCITLGLGWVAALRRRVTRQTDQIRTQISKEAALEAHNRTIVTNASDCIFTTDLKGNFTSLNLAGEKLFGYASADALGMNLRDLVDPADAERQPDLIASLADQGKSSARFELRLVTKDDRHVWTEINACLVHTDGQLVGLLGIARDIDDRKRIEDELKKARDAAQANTEAKSAFLANMSHEIRTPMNGVIGMSNLILETPLNGMQREYAETIRNSAEGLLTVLNDILDFSKIEAGKLHFETLDFDLLNNVQECLELVATRATAKGIELSIFTAPGQSRLVRGDAGRLRQVLLNLVSNAIKFTSQGEVGVVVSVDSETPTQAIFRFDINDTGIGIAEADIARLFLPFSQADVSTTRRFGGTGLGLVISKQIAELMGGKIGVTSTPGQGSTFWFTAKLEKRAPSPTELATENVAALTGKRLLVVENHPSNRRIISAYAAHWGLRCEFAGSGADALAALQGATPSKDPFAAVLLEARLPDTDELTLARKIRADTRLVNIPLVLMTAADRKLAADDLKSVGVAAVVAKPLRPADLLEALRKAIDPDSPESISNGPPVEHAEISLSDQAEPPIRLLIGEDNVVNQRVLQQQLSKLGHTADIAGNGLEVLQALERAPYDVILMDCQMPEMDGYDASRTIRKDARFAKIKIIAMTANAMRGDREKCLNAGMDDYLTKPTRIIELKKALVRCRPGTGRGLETGSGTRATNSTLG